ncbi:MAG TPA: hypothetical protein ENH82_07555 [bacterium]|nr:hypothetical protein [bacterium]
MSDHPFKYVPGDGHSICDVSGFKVYHSKLKRQWNGLMTRPESYSPRHPQLDVKGRHEKQALSHPRPRPADRFLEMGEITADDL